MGGELVAAAEAFLRAEGAPVVRLMVRADNAGVAAFYESIGYETGDFLVFGKRF